MTVSQQISPSALRAYKLSKYANGQPGKLLLEAKKIKRATSQFMSKNGAKEAAKRMKALKKTATTTKKIADNLKKVQDLFLKKIPGTADTDKATKASGLLALLFVIGATGLLKLSEFLAERTFDDISILNNDITKTNKIATDAALKLKNTQTKIDKINQELSRNAQEYSRLNKQTEKIGQDVASAKKQANDALYETREGRKIVEKKINDNLYELRSADTKIESKYTQLKNEFDKYIAGVVSGFQAKISATVASIQKAQELADRDIAKATQEISKTNVQVSLQQKTIDTASKVVQALPTSLNTGFRVVQEATKKLVESNIIPIQQSTKKWGVSITPATVTPATITVGESGGVTVTPSTGGVAQVTYADFSSSDIAREINAESKKQDGQIAALAGGLSAVAGGVADAKNTANQALLEARNKGVGFAPEITSLKGDIDKVKADLNNVDTRLKEQEKVNSAAIPKLDQILGFLPLIPGRAADAIRPSIPTIPQIENAAATGTCRTTQTGGCMRRALDDTASNINSNNNTNAANILDAVNTGLNGALLTGQQTILQRLGII